MSQFCPRDDGAGCRSSSRSRPCPDRRAIEWPGGWAKSLKIRVILSLVYAAIVAAFESMIGIMQPTPGGDARDHHRRCERSRARPRRLAARQRREALRLREPLAAGVVPAARWPTPTWRRRSTAPRATYRAVPVEGEEADRIDAEHPHPAWFRFMTGYPPRKIVCWSRARRARASRRAGAGSRSEGSSDPPAIAAPAHGVAGAALAHCDCPQDALDGHGDARTLYRASTVGARRGARVLRDGAGVPARGSRFATCGSVARPVARCCMVASRALTSVTSRRRDASSLRAMSECVAVLGATGVYGRHLVPRLVAAGYRRARAGAKTRSGGARRGLRRRGGCGGSLRRGVAARGARRLRRRDQPRHRAPESAPRGRLREERPSSDAGHADLRARVPRRGRRAGRPAEHRDGPRRRRRCVGRRDDVRRRGSSGRRRRARGRARDGGDDRAIGARLADPARRTLLRPGTGFDDDWFARARDGKLRLPGEGDD